MSAIPEWQPLGGADHGLFGAASCRGFTSSTLRGEPPLDPEDGPDVDEGMTRAGMERAAERRRLRVEGERLIREDWARQQGREKAS